MTFTAAAATCVRNIVLGLSILFGVAAAQAADDTAAYPTRPIHVIVPFAPGGASDFAIRMLEPGLSQQLGQPVVIDNRPGAAGNIAMELAARAAPDGYNLFLGNVGTVSINPHFYPDLKVVPERDFLPVSVVAETPGILVASPTFPPNSLKDMVAYVKAHPGKINYAAAGISTLNTLEMEQFRRAAGLEMTQVPYKGGAGPAIVDLIGGTVDVMFVTISSAAEQVKAGQLKAFAVSTRERMALLPDVPSILELGYPDSVSSSWQGLFAPTGTPQPIIAKLHAAVARAMADPKIQSLMTKAGMLPTWSKSPEDFKTYLASESARWARVVAEVAPKTK
ncbi:MAG TPA: tripartite tricarboxylate transporter substrate binding protein [Pseudolabrys sp.]|jgi:tripartite-type tricarboxylate transporter receptor subunit TctC|nr:tripartite tricarboxylate transporter substrate binding protein [Pseudolabrys sp.]